MLEIEPAANGFEEGLTAGQEVAGCCRRYSGSRCPKARPSRLTQPEKWREAVTESPAGRNLEKALDNLSKWTRSAALHFATDLHRRKMDAFPGLEQFPELAGLGFLQLRRRRCPRQRCADQKIQVPIRRAHQ